MWIKNNNYKCDYYVFVLLLVIRIFYLIFIIAWYFLSDHISAGHHKFYKSYLQIVRLQYNLHKTHNYRQSVVWLKCKFTDVYISHISWMADVNTCQQLSQKGLLQTVSNAANMNLQTSIKARFFACTDLDNCQQLA